MFPIKGTQVYGPLILRNARLRDDSLVDIAIEGGTIRSITVSTLSAEAGGSPRVISGLISLDKWMDQTRVDSRPVEVDVECRLMLPALINGHAHLDKTFFGTDWQPHQTGEGVPARVHAERSIRAGLTASVTDRATALAHEMVRLGTGTARTHVDIDNELGLSSLEAMLSLRDSLKDRLDLQVVAFPQSGILKAPGVADLLAAALAAGADVIGGLDPFGFDGDARRHLDVVFGLADRYGAGVDIHLHDLGPVAIAQYEQICDRTRALQLHGRVVVSHAYGLGSVPLSEAQRMGALLAHAGVAVMTNGPAGPMPPVLAMRAEGATVFAGSDNIRDAWWPYGNGDMFDVARMVAYQSNFRTDSELEVALDMVTDAAAAGIGAAPYGIAESNPAHLVIVDSPGAAGAIANPPSWRCVIHAGELVSASRTVTHHLGRTPKSPHAARALIH